MGASQGGKKKEKAEKGMPARRVCSDRAENCVKNGQKREEKREKKKKKKTRCRSCRTLLPGVWGGWPS